MTRNPHIPQPYKFKPEIQRVALDVIAECGNRQSACDAVGINISTFNRQLRKDPTFRECYTAAHGRWIAGLEALALTMAKGTLHKKVGPGGVLYDDIKYHPTVLIHLLKVNDPKKHGERKTIEHNHTHTQQIGLDSLSQTQRDQLQAIILSQLEPKIEVEIGPVHDVESEDDEQPEADLS